MQYNVKLGLRLVNIMAALTKGKMVLLGVSIYLVMTFFLTFIGIEKQNEGLKIFIISMLLTPLAGLLFMVTRKKNYARLRYYHCEACDYIFPVKLYRCPICQEKGLSIKLHRYESPHKIARAIRAIELE